MHKEFMLGTLAAMFLQRDTASEGTTHITPHHLPPVRLVQISQHGTNRGRNTLAAIW